MHFKILAGVAALMTITTLSAQNANDLFLVSKDGSFEIDGIKARIVHFTDNWEMSQQNDASITLDQGYPRTDAKSCELKGKFRTKNAVFDFSEKIVKTSPGVITYECSLKSDKSVPTNELSLHFTLPVEHYSGKKIEVGSEKIVLPPELPEKNQLGSKDKFGKFFLACANYKLTVEGDGGMLVQDDRKFNTENYSLRVRFPMEGKEISEAKASFKISLEPYNTNPISIKSAVNMGFTDDVEGDQKGGWTDQGPENDLRMMKPGLKKIGGASFEIIDPAANNGKSCIVFGGSMREYFPKSAQTSVNGETYKQLCILHALAWAPKDKVEIGKIVVTYQDKTNSTFPIIAKEHVGDWWSPTSVAKGQVAWTGENKSSYVGLFLSSFNLEPKPITAISFEGAGNSVWMIAAVSGSNDDLPTSVAAPFYIVPSNDWKPFEFSKDVVKGSALDFSFLLDAPAGKYGFLKIADGRFIFEKRAEVPVRFYGVNLCFTANYLDKETCEKLADRLAACGYNTVRFHHFDNELAAKTGNSTTALDLDSLDKLEYLFSALKKRGMYITIDLYISRKLKAGEIPELNRAIAEHHDFKAAVPVLESARKNWEDFSRNLLEHVNPYTGMKWKDDPALINISLVNENTIMSCWNSSPDIKKIYEDKFAAWLKEKGLESSDSTAKAALMKTFLMETNDKSFARMREFLKSIGNKALLTDQNMWDNVPMALMRDKYDFVDNHFYWDHPSFPVKSWSLPSGLKNVSTLSVFLSTPGGMIPSRLFGKPFTLTEFNWASPGMYRGESGPITGALACLQDWDGLYRFAYSHSRDAITKDVASNYFDVSTDPINLLSDRIGLLLFLRGDVKPADISFPVVISPKYMDNPKAPMNYPKLAQQLGFVGRAGTIVDNGNVKYPAGCTAVLSLEDLALKSSAPVFKISQEKGSEAEVAEKIKASCDLKKGALDIEKGFARSSTGEIEIDKASGTFRVITPRSEAFVMGDKGKIEGVFMSVENMDKPAVICATSVDGKDLKDSERILVLHLTDVMNSKIKFDSKKMKLLQTWGTMPHLARKGEAEISLKMPSGSQPRIWGIDSTGKQIGEIKAKIAPNGTVTFKVDTLGLETPCFAYEITR
ncbi:MAG TPA: hypothetical protein DET40_00175 [Lentisphaeria bacterium]|nr:MAG: hypothetical protein A2X45_22580 [Lentisphaerae bacterium GWF2_50_93]HCE41948.1 hypothetical protein [Lentisphaeria bacterium]